MGLFNQNRNPDDIMENNGSPDIIICNSKAQDTKKVKTANNKLEENICNYPIRQWVKYKFTEKKHKLLNTNMNKSNNKGQREEIKSHEHQK